MSGSLLLVAASGLAREVAESARRAGWDVLGCLDDNPDLAGTEIMPGLEVLGGLERAEYPEALLLLCAGKGRVRQGIANRLADFGIGDERYAVLMDTSVAVPDSCTVGAGSILLAGTILTACVTLGKHVVCMPHVVLLMTTASRISERCAQAFSSAAASQSAGVPTSGWAAAFVSTSRSVLEPWSGWAVLRRGTYAEDSRCRHPSPSVERGDTMRVLVYPHDLGIGGSQMNAIEIAAATRDQGHEVLVYGRPGVLNKRIEELGLEFVAPVPPPSHRPTLRVVRDLRRLIKHRRIDVVHGYEWPPILEGQLAVSGTAAVCVGTVMSMAVAPPSFHAASRWSSAPNRLRRWNEPVAAATSRSSSHPLTRCTTRRARTST